MYSISNGIVFEKSGKTLLLVIVHDLEICNRSFQEEFRSFHETIDNLLKAIGHLNLKTEHLK